MSYVDSPREFKSEYIISARNQLRTQIEIYDYNQKNTVKARQYEHDQ